MSPNTARLSTLKRISDFKKVSISNNSPKNLVFIFEK